jgi:hypothetical protein
VKNYDFYKFQQDVMIILNDYLIDDIINLNVIKLNIYIKFNNKKSLKIDLKDLILDCNKIYITDKKSFLLYKENAPAIILKDF